MQVSVHVRFRSKAVRDVIKEPPGRDPVSVENRSNHFGFRDEFGAKDFCTSRKVFEQRFREFLFHQVGLFIGQVIGVRADDIVVMNFAAIEQSRNAKIEFIELQRFVYLQQRQGALWF